MRKLFLLSLLFCIFLISCDNKDDPATGPSAKELIKGDWLTLEMKYELFNASGQKLAEEKKADYPKFIFADGKATAYEGAGNEVSSSYTISESSGKAYTLIMTLGDLPQRMAITEVDNTSMALRVESAGDTQKLGTTLEEKEARLATTVFTIKLGKVQTTE